MNTFPSCIWKPVRSAESLKRFLFLRNWETFWKESEAEFVIFKGLELLRIREGFAPLMRTWQNWQLVFINTNVFIKHKTCVYWTQTLCLLNTTFVFIFINTVYFQLRSSLQSGIMPPEGTGPVKPMTSTQPQLLVSGSEEQAGSSDEYSNRGSHENFL